jgi:hypothetical protein
MLPAPLAGFPFSARETRYEQRHANAAPTHRLTTRTFRPIPVFPSSLFTQCSANVLRRLALRLWGSDPAKETRKTS